MSSKVYETVTSRIIQLIETKQELPWSRPWAADVVPMNYVSKSPYRGFNHLIASFLYSEPYFMSYKQVKAAGGHVRKGEKSMPVIYWNFIYLLNGKKVSEDTEGAKRVGYLRYYNVFNQSQIEGIKFPEIEEAKNDNNPIDVCDDLISSVSGLDIRHEVNSAFFSPIHDYINMPLLSSFTDSYGYYATLFHELGHWTGHESRLKRLKNDNLAAFGSSDYSKEELTAELFSAFMCGHTGISNESLNLNSAAYIKNWLSALKSDTRMLIDASSKAQKAVDYILKTKHNLARS